MHHHCYDITTSTAINQTSQQQQQNQHQHQHHRHQDEQLAHRLELISPQADRQTLGQVTDPQAATNCYQQYNQQLPIDSNSPPSYHMVLDSSGFEGAGVKAGGASSSSSSSRRGGDRSDDNNNKTSCSVSVSGSESSGARQKSSNSSNNNNSNSNSNKTIYMRRRIRSSIKRENSSNDSSTTTGNSNDAVGPITTDNNINTEANTNSNTDESALCHHHHQYNENYSEVTSNFIFSPTPTTTTTTTTSATIANQLADNDAHIITTATTTTTTSTSTSTSSSSSSSSASGIGAPVALTNMNETLSSSPITNKRLPTTGATTTTTNNNNNIDNNSTSNSNSTNKASAALVSGAHAATKSLETEVAASAYHHHHHYQQQQQHHQQHQRYLSSPSPSSQNNSSSQPSPHNSTTNNNQNQQQQQQQQHNYNQHQQLLVQNEAVIAKRSRYMLSSASRKRLTSFAMNIIGNANAAISQQQQPVVRQQVKSFTMASILDTSKDYSKDNSSIVVLKSSSATIKTTPSMTNNKSSPNSSSNNNKQQQQQQQSTTTTVTTTTYHQDSLDDIEVMPSHQHPPPNYASLQHQQSGKQTTSKSNNNNNNNNNSNDDGLTGGGMHHSVHLPNLNYIVVSKSSETTAPTTPSALGVPHKGPIKRDHWDKNIEFLLAVVGFAVDLGNIWRFPYICYRNGGGAFLIPYMIMFALGGLPIFYLEMSLGQYFASGCLTVWKRICPIVKGIGYAMCIINFFTGLYYNTIISWAVYFLFESFTSELPWTRCGNSWNTARCRTIDQREQYYNLTNSAENTTDIFQNLVSPAKEFYEREVLKIHLSTGIDDLGSIRWPLASYLAIVFIFVYFAIWKGVKSTGKAVWITALLPYFVLIPLLIRGIFLEGAEVGIRYYLYPNWEKLKEITVWIDAAKQIFFSLGPGFGTLLALSSYNKFNHNCFRDALIAASVNCFTSFIAGFVIFSVLGYMATIQHQDISSVATDGPGLVFQVYPEALATMKGSCFWSILFFIMVITLGIDSTFGGLEAVITGLCDEYPRVLRAHREIFIGCLIIVIYLCSLPTTTFGGNYVITVLDSYGTSLSLLFIVFIETASVCWIFGVKRFSDRLEEMYGYRPGLYWRICWTYISPTLLLFIFIAAIIQEADRYKVLESDGYRYPSWAVTLGWLMTASSLVCIPAYAIYLFATTSGTFTQRMKKCITPIEETHLDHGDKTNDMKLPNTELTGPQ